MVRLGNLRSITVTAAGSAWPRGRVSAACPLRQGDCGRAANITGTNYVIGGGLIKTSRSPSVAIDVHGDVAVVGDQRVAVQGVLHQPGDVDRVSS